MVSLAEARNVAFANRQRARTGGDPLAEKRHGQGVPTVEEAAAVVLEQQRPGWRNAKHARDWPRSLRAYAFPRIGALPVSEVTDALATVRVSQASVTTKRAFEFLVLTAARSGEVRLATWDEMDLDAGVWTVPAARMKAKRDHRVPLSRRALAILHDVQRLSDGTSLAFRSPRGKPLSNMTLSKLIKELGIAAVPHGFRSSFRDWAAERTSTPREVVEAALAHTVQNPTEAAYARSDLFERRRRLMDDWAAYLSGAPEYVVAGRR